MRAIYKRELKSYFNSMTGYIILAFLVAFTGIYFMVYNLYSGYPYFSHVLMSVNFILLLAVPVLTMRSFSEERKNKTDQLLLCAPVSLSKIVLGKYLAMATVFAIPCLIYCFYPLIIKSFGTAHLKVDYTAIFMFFLMGCVYISIGAFLSSLTESQVIAAVTTFGTLLVIYLWDGLVDFIPFEGLQEIMKNFSIVGRLNQVASGHIFDISSLVFYVSLIGLFLFFTTQSIQKRRWS